MVVNLFYSSPHIIPVQGFGYLLPRSLPLEGNPELALGVIFDTDATPGQDAVPGTKVTVMIGGHWWSDLDMYPTEEEGLDKAKTLLKRHLGIKDEPIVTRVSLQRDCIPQYPVNHDEKMSRLSCDLNRLYGGRLRVAGNSYTGVGVNDCIKAARNVVRGLVNGRSETGLDSFTSGRQWSWQLPQVVKFF